MMKFRFCGHDESFLPAKDSLNHIDKKEKTLMTLLNKNIY